MVVVGFGAVGVQDICLGSRSTVLAMVAGFVAVQD
jgi:hypothetical protein